MVWQSRKMSADEREEVNVVVVERMRLGEMLKCAGRNVVPTPRRDSVN